MKSKDPTCFLTKISGVIRQNSPVHYSKEKNVYEIYLKVFVSILN